MARPKHTLLVICGTRPEGIKLAPVIRELRRHDEFDVKLCLTGQHRELLAHTLEFFELKADFNLNLMVPDQSLHAITSGTLARLAEVLDQAKPDVVFVQGDTSTAFAGALASFYSKIPVAHVEAGLRTHDRSSPFPEEMNRTLLSRLAHFHFAPTATAAKNLAAEGISTHVFVVGNTSIDALLHTVSVTHTRASAFEEQFPFATAGHKRLLVTCHRRETFGEPLEAICRAVNTLAQRFPELEVIYPVHPNPNVLETVTRLLKGVERVHLVDPIDYPTLVWLLGQSHGILTDSGGIQEEAATLGKPVLVLREITERPEGIDAGIAQLVGTKEESIVAGVTALLSDAALYRRMAQPKTLYGDGTASVAIAKTFKHIFRT